MSLVLGVGSGGGAPKTAQYVVLVADATLPNERVLTGTANRIVVTDGGAGLPVTLSPGALIVQTDQPNTWTTGVQTINTGAAATVGLVVNSAAGQTADLVQVQAGGTSTAVAIHALGNANRAFQGILIENLHAGTSADSRLDLKNDVGVITGIFLGSSTRAGGYANNALYYAGNVITFMSNNTVATAGVSPIRFMAGGYNVTAQITILSQANGSYVGIQEIAPTAQLHVKSRTSATIAAKFVGAAAQTANLTNWETSAGVALLEVEATGVHDYRWAMGNSTKDPTTDAPDDWIEVKIGGSTFFCPAYVA